MLPQIPSVATGFATSMTPTILSATPTDGGLAPGRYLVTATIERDGLESGAAQPMLVELLNGGGIELRVTHGDADFLSLYCSDPNGKLPYFVLFDADPISGDSVYIDAAPTTDPCEFKETVPYELVRHCKANHC